MSRRLSAQGVRRYYADPYQQSLAKNPNGYRCHASTGVKFPEHA